MLRFQGPMKKRCLAMVMKDVVGRMLRAAPGSVLVDCTAYLRDVGDAQHVRGGVAEAPGGGGGEELRTRSGELLIPRESKGYYRG
eukprot:Skav221956  [mRNA]  locus=scaffold195:639329:640291:- [translate_table: standard]